jgi:hypothetical protein
MEADGEVTEVELLYAPEYEALTDAGAVGISVCVIVDVIVLRREEVIEIPVVVTVAVYSWVPE